jgi:iron complex transport system ATP-binding protein
LSLLALDEIAVRIAGKTLLQGVSLRVDAGELLGLIGPNGAGKSTLVKAVVQLLPYRGQIRVAGEDLARLPALERARRVAYLGQEDQLQWPIDVYDLVALGRHPYRGSWWRGAGAPRPADERAIEAALRATDVWTLRGRRVTELSGGERARVRLARALVVEAPLLLADEPVGALDPLHQLKVLERIRAHCAGGGGAIVVMHDLTLASRFCDRLLLLDRGRHVASGPPTSVLTEAALGAVYGIRAVVGEHRGQGYILPWSCVEGQ